jgi:hypothetical protein
MFETVLGAVVVLAILTTLTVWYVRRKQTARARVLTVSDSGVLAVATGPGSLSPEQLATLKADILADPLLATAYDETVAAAYNQPAQPGFVVWKTSVNPDEIMRNGMDWTRVDNLTVGRARIWDWLTRLGSFDPSKPNIRAGIDAAWVGTAQDLAVRAIVYTHCKRAATRAEKLFATGIGTDASPATLGFEGYLTYADISQARNLP